MFFKGNTHPVHWLRSWIIIKPIAQREFTSSVLHSNFWQISSITLSSWFVSFLSKQIMACMVVPGIWAVSNFTFPKAGAKVSLDGPWVGTDVALDGPGAGEMVASNGAGTHNWLSSVGSVSDSSNGHLIKSFRAYLRATLSRHSLWNWPWTSFSSYFGYYFLNSFPKSINKGYFVRKLSKTVSASNIALNVAVVWIYLNRNLKSSVLAHNDSSVITQVVSVFCPLKTIPATIINFLLVFCSTFMLLQSRVSLEWLMTS